MLQFTEDRIAALRDRSRRDHEVVDALLAATAEVRSKPLMIQETAVATWGHYFACPDHAVSLVHELDRPDSYRCPVGGERLSGEPYEGAWWRLANGKNADGARDLAYLWLLTGDETYRALSLRIIDEYARRYPSYEVHGGIPHNGPGKANCQTLCEGLFIRALAQAWDILRDTVDGETRVSVERDLFAQAGDFLASHITKQRHNHEVLVTGALGMVGILLDRGDLIAAARDGSYGLVEQLDRSILQDGFWFEGSVHYHIFALEAFFTYETFASHTTHSLWSLDGYRKMLRFGAALLRSDGTPPVINDGTPTAEIETLHELYEFAYAQDGDEEWADVLRFFYARVPRGGTATFLFGVEKIPAGKEIDLRDYHDETGSGLTVLRGGGEEYLIVKHGPFGGEHDHYDRLGLSYEAYGERLLPDLGTTWYGSPMHYRYYKNSAPHNVAVLDGGNHPPADCRTLRFERRADGVLLDVAVNWKKQYRDFDSHYRTEWIEGPYRDAAMRRVVLKAEGYFVDYVEVEAPNASIIDLNALIVAEAVDEGAALRPCRPFGGFDKSGPFGAPYSYLGDAVTYIGGAPAAIRFTAPKCRLEVRLLDAEVCDAEGAVETLRATGPTNPPQKKVVFLVRRQRGPVARFLAVYAAYTAGGRPPRDARAAVSADGAVSVVVTLADGSEKLHRIT